jgi:hypothetical protein
MLLYAHSESTWQALGDSVNRLAKQLLKLARNPRPVHPLSLTLVAFFLASLGAMFVEYGQPMMPEAPKWIFKLYSQRSPSFMQFSQPSKQQRICSSGSGELPRPKQGACLIA